VPAGFEDGENGCCGAQGHGPAKEKVAYEALVSRTFLVFLVGKSPSHGEHRDRRDSQAGRPLQDVPHHFILPQTGLSPRWRGGPPRQVRNARAAGKVSP
jgi:hypothetical protein